LLSFFVDCTSIGELVLREQRPFLQESGGMWRKDEASPLVGVSAFYPLLCFYTVDWILGQ